MQKLATMDGAPPLEELLAWDVDCWQPRRGAPKRAKDLDASIFKLQTPAKIASIEGTSWTGAMKVGVREDGVAYIHLAFDKDDLHVTPKASLHGTFWQDLPYHVTLGPVVFFNMVQDLWGDLPRRFSASFKKMSPDRRKTAYVVTGGTLFHVLKQCSEIGFEPIVAWHVSL